MIEHKHSSDASGFHHDRSNGHEAQSSGSAECGNLAEITANNTFLAQQTTYHPLLLVPAPMVVGPNMDPQRQR